MNDRKLRIAWSVVWGIIAASLIALWARSYRGNSFLSVRGHSIVSFYGTIYVDAWEPNPIGEGFWDLGKGLRIPFFVPVSLATFSALVTIPWLSWSRRFSLRTLLIATTVIAVGLGLIAWLTR